MISKCDASAELYSGKELGDRIVNHIGKFIENNECKKCQFFMCENFSEFLLYGIDDIIDEYNKQKETEDLAELMLKKLEITSDKEIKEEFENENDGDGIQKTKTSD